jgi:hypothetical protein
MDESVRLNNARRGKRMSGGIFEGRTSASPCCRTAIAFSETFPLNAGIVNVRMQKEEWENLQHEVWFESS